MLSVANFLARFLVNSHIFIGFCAVSLSWFTIIIKNGPMPSYGLIGMIFSSTVFLYSAHRFVQSKAYGEMEDERSKSLVRNRPLFVLFAISGALGSTFFFFREYHAHLYQLFLPAILAGAYVIPWNKDWKRVRDLPYVKIFIISLCWSWITLILPVQLLHLDTAGIFPMFVERSLFLLAITIPFDIRDLGPDRKKGLLTFPLLLGIRYSKRVALAIIIIAIAFSFFTYTLGFYSWEVLASLISTYGVTISMINITNLNRGLLFYALGVDGVMILPLLFYLIINVNI